MMEQVETHEEMVKRFFAERKNEDRKSYDNILRKYPTQNMRRQQETKEYEEPMGLIKSPE